MWRVPPPGTSSIVISIAAPLRSALLCCSGNYLGQPMTNAPSASKLADENARPNLNRPLTCLRGLPRASADNHARLAVQRPVQPSIARFQLPEPDFKVNRPPASAVAMLFAIVNSTLPSVPTPPEIEAAPAIGRTRPFSIATVWL